jgi:glyoxylase-like metal-dependent hydrolase (beta-lactamase superfamily II)/rhodanese-related sulfurtransferase
MKVTQIYTSCLAHAAYYVESDGQVALFDPLKDTQPYLDRLGQNGHQLRYIFETHFHADFVSGHQDLYAKTGAPIIFGPTAEPQFDALVAIDRERFRLGTGFVEVLHTPGHTLESCCYLLYHDENTPFALISGDTLFIGDVGRPDLAQYVVKELSPDFLARKMYHSLREVIMPLPDHIIVYPNHGAGSACGKKMSADTSDTLGHQKSSNYALDPTLTEDAFVAALLTGQTTPPRYFPNNVLLNKMGCPTLENALQKGLSPLVPEQINRYLQQGALVVDSRTANDFARSFIPNSIHIGLDGSFANWAGELISPLDQALIVVAENSEKVYETLIRLGRVGFLNVLGFAAGGLQTWEAEGHLVDAIYRINAEALLELEEQKLQDEEYFLLDVRRPDEFNEAHLWGAVSIPLSELPDRLDEIPTELPVLVYCAGGYRSMMAASILRKNGIQKVADLAGGINAVKQFDTWHPMYHVPAPI